MRWRAPGIRVGGGAPTRRAVSVSAEVAAKTWSSAPNTTALGRPTPRSRVSRVSLRPGRRTGANPRPPPPRPRPRTAVRQTSTPGPVQARAGGPALRGVDRADQPVGVQDQPQRRGAVRRDDQVVRRRARAGASLERVAVEEHQRAGQAGRAQHRLRGGRGARGVGHDRRPHEPHRADERLELAYLVVQRVRGAALGVARPRSGRTRRRGGHVRASSARRSHVSADSAAPCTSTIGEPPLAPDAVSRHQVAGPYAEPRRRACAPGGRRVVDEGEDRARDREHDDGGAGVPPQPSPHPRAASYGNGLVPGGQYATGLGGIDHVPALSTTAAQSSSRAWAESTSAPSAHRWVTASAGSGSTSTQLPSSSTTRTPSVVSTVRPLGGLHDRAHDAALGRPRRGHRPLEHVRLRGSARRSG